VSLTDNYIKNKVVDIAVTSDFDPCQPNSETCFCKDRQPQDVVNFGDIVLVGKSPQEYEQWLKSNNKNIKFKKIS
jgi:hypothetical protein